MRSSAEWVAIVVWMLASAACADGPPASPDPPAGRWLGTWSGVIVSQAVGLGTATIVLDHQAGPASSPLFGGRWRVSFADMRFNAEGTLSANLDRSGEQLVCFLSRAAVPCPDEPGGVAERAIAATLTVANDRLRGGYVVGGCPGGTLDLLRQH